MSITSNNSDRTINAGASTSNNSDSVRRLGDYGFDFPNCDHIDKYEKISRIGKGTFGEVFRARHKQTRQEVALKRILMDNEQEGFPITAIREIRILKMLKSEFVINLIEVCRSTESANGKAISYLVFEFCHHDLAGLIQEAYDKISPLPNVKCIVKQLLEGLHMLHTSKIIHRDMKSSNILITKHGELKIADFGLARPYTDTDKDRKYTNRVVTLWYRPPELLLGERNYACAIDLWGVGCIMAELFIRGPLMKGSSEQNQLILITETVGAINEKVWPTVEEYPLYRKLSSTLKNPKSKPGRLSRICQDVLAQDLLKKLLCLDPAKRIDGNAALDHDFFWEAPEVASKESLARSLAPISQSQFEFTVRKNSRQIHQGNMAPRLPNSIRPIGHRPGPSANNDGQYRDHVY